jgi:hypothetical protein
MSEQTKQVNYRLPVSVVAALDRLALDNGRPITAEVLHAIRRHLASPPRLEVPELADVPADVPAGEAAR